MPSRASLLFAVLIASTCIALADTVPIVVPGAPAGSTVALAINNKGDIVGDTFIGSGERLVGSDFVDINGAFSLFTLPGSVSFIPSAINDAGQIVGNALDGHSYLYSGGAFSPIDIPGAEYVIANGINDSGEIVGLYTDAFGGHGFSEKNGVVTTINVPGSLGTIATGINNNGDIVGYYGVRDAEDQPARVNVVGFLEKDGVFSTFSCPGYPGGLYTGVLGFGDTEPNAINDAGQIVGLCGPMVGLGDTYGFSDS
ncbi:MAG: hypothetical protein JO336_24100, partial [Acidobacteriia bacterium]|nr:hypothetical protein [Terriglobia bacterium]